MVVKDLEGNESKFKVLKKRSRTRKHSKLHNIAIDILKEVFSGLIICEEVPIKVKPGLDLFLDIYLPTYKFVIEVHGKQHYEFCPHFHKHHWVFGRQQLNDTLKKEWCEINHFGFLELAYNESRDEWGTKIRNAIGRHTGQVF